MNDFAKVSTTSNLAPLTPADEVDFLDDDPGRLRPASATVARWLSEAGRLHRSTAGSPEFYTDAARFAVEVVGLDAASALTYCGGAWEIVGSQSRDTSSGFAVDFTVFDRLESEAVTWYQPTIDEGSEAAKTQAVVVAPVVDSAGKLIAAIYGVRNTLGDNRRRGIRPLEARLMQLLAESVSVGIARMDRETESARTRVLLEQAFSPTVAHYIQAHPECLNGQLREVTLLFADLCGFTSLAELMSPTDCYDLLASVMELLTEIVSAKQGVVVDYFGDGLLAMWNAPQEQSEHATLACSAAQEMADCLSATSSKWCSRLNGPLQLAVGLHSGPALVGNAGTRSRIKYGPRGNAVHIASRVQTASKQLRLPLVMTKATQNQLSPEFHGMRVCTARLPGLEQELDLYTAYPTCRMDALALDVDCYVAALERFESGDLSTAHRMLAVLADQSGFAPARFLEHYTSDQLLAAQGRRQSDKTVRSLGPVIELAGK